MTGALQTILGRPKTVLTMMVVMVVAGILTYINIPKEANPDIDVPVYYVSITQQGISPKDSERLLVRPMETELRGLEGLKELTAIASQSHAGIVLEFNIGTDKDKVLADIREIEATTRRGRLVMEGRFRLGIIPTIAPYLLPQVLPVLKVEFPGMRLELREAVTGSLVEDTASGRIDAFVAGVGTGGTITGVGEVLREKLKWGGR